MKMIRLTDAIKVVEEVFQCRHGWRVDQVEERFPYRDSEETPIARLLEMYSNSIIDRLINDVEAKEATK
jgi:hypothetical protein